MPSPVMRARRSAKLAEYLSTYALLEHIGIHPTALIEKRDAAVGIGLYVRDACDAGTSLLAVPSRRFCANSVLSKVGLKCQFTNPWQTTSQTTTTTALAGPSLSPRATDTIQDGIVSFLTGSSQWPELAWRLTLEQHRSVSHLWGWLQSLPSAAELKDQTEAAERHCRIHHTMLLPYYLKGRQRMQDETLAAYRQLRTNNLLVSYTTFYWAVEVLLSRGLLLPLAWPVERSANESLLMRERASARGDEDVEEQERGLFAQSPPEENTLELGVVPFLDLVNAPDDEGRVVNARIEVASTLEELPAFFQEEVVVTSAAKGRDGTAELEELLRTHYYLCLTLLAPLRASEEVIVDWDVPVVTTGVLHSAEDQLVSRLLKYKF
ncbi:putative mitochondrial hypothetical protein [Leptomonas pyrrhocoris]|uniref:Uncharacterized protein n=1 Tax=Leptomonas pyrrhocoris TaxID=157538 RepID=A0A0M9G564_LEPPY|nr:putative mitochondrial hypothetical protein [Leptomonas pyrrhocoris]KPA82487.1 putative mitochondrial hypothetical protein [Leptomonas pyrrhocoris]|eukprot:XP_015660926.1 putative mitochondrial hypothetical protein [Leptomonas pyrrhocoris]